MADKPKLIKFSCSTCGTRLAVPVELAGVSDQCPKCGSVVVSPALPVQTVATQAPMAPPQPAASIFPPATLAPIHAAHQPVPEPAALAMPSLEDVFSKRAPKQSPPPVAEPHQEIWPAAEEVPPLKILPPQEAAPRLAENPLWNAIAQAPPLVVPARRQASAVEHPLPVDEAKAYEEENAAATERPASPLIPTPAHDEYLPPEEAEPPREFAIGDLLAQVVAEKQSPRAQAGERRIDFRKVIDVPPRPPGRSRLKRVLGWGIAAFLLVDLGAVAWFSRSWLFGKKTSPSSKPAATAPGATKGVKIDSSGTAEPVAEHQAPPTPPAPAIVEDKKPSAPEATPVAVVPPAALTETLSAARLTPGITSTESTPVAASTAEVPMKTAPTTATEPAEPKLDPPPVETAASVSPKVEEKKEPEVKELPAPASPQPDTMKSPTAELGLQTASLRPGQASITGDTALASVASLPSPPPIESTATKPAPRSEPASEPAAAPSSTNKNLKVSAVPPEAEPALAALNSFLNAGSSSERNKWCQKAEELRGAMEKYYQTHPAGPIKAGQIDFLKRYPAGKGATAYCMFELSGGDFNHPVLALVDEPAKNEGRVDWEAFTEFKDDALENFLLKKETSVTKFRVMIRRKHSYEKDVPDLLLKDCFELFLPRSDFTARVYCPKGGATQRQLSTQLPWEMEMAAIVELAWRTKGRFQWVEIVSIPGYGWKS